MHIHVYAIKGQDRWGLTLTLFDDDTTPRTHRRAVRAWKTAALVTAGVSARAMTRSWSLALNQQCPYSPCARSWAAMVSGESIFLRIWDRMKVGSVVGLGLDRETGGLSQVCSSKVLYVCRVRRRGRTDHGDRDTVLEHLEAQHVREGLHGLLAAGVRRHSGEGEDAGHTVLCCFWIVFCWGLFGLHMYEML